MRTRQGLRHEDKKRAEGKSTREEIVDPKGRNKGGVQITKNDGGKRGRKARVTQRRFREWDARDDI